MSAGERLVLDTSAYSHFRSGHAALLDRMARAASILVPVVVLGELDAAFLLGRRTRENRRGLDDFLGEPFVRVLDVTAVSARHYARIFAALRRAGTSIPLNDVWIAACAMEHGGIVLTFDRDFLRVPDLDVVMLDVPGRSASSPPD